MASADFACSAGPSGQRPETLIGQGNALVCGAERGRPSPEGARQENVCCALSGLGMKKYCDVLACADPRPLAWAVLFQAFGLTSSPRVRLWRDLATRARHASR